MKLEKVEQTLEIDEKKGIENIIYQMIIIIINVINIIQ